MRGQKGFSMIELMIAAAIFAFAMLAIAGMSYTSVYLVSSSNSRFTATTIAQNIIEEARNKGKTFAETLDGDVKCFDEVGNPVDCQNNQGGIVFTRTINTQTSGQGVLLRVRVSWTERGEVKNVVQTAIIY